MKVSNGTIVRTVVLAIALLNQVLTVFGINPLPFSDEEIYEGVSMIVTAISAIWAWWKTNGFTRAGITGENYIKSLKAAEKAKKTEE